jgi:hypothetical protein
MSKPIDIQALLKDIEWNGNVSDDEEDCPWCGEGKHYGGHDPECQLKQAIDHGAPLQTQQATTDLAEKQEILRTLAKDSKASVRKAVAANEFIPLDVMELLAKDPSTNVQDALYHNESIPVDIMRQIVNGRSKTNGLARTIIVNSRSPSDLIDIALKASPKTIHYRYQQIIDHPNVSKEALGAIVERYKNPKYDAYSYIGTDAKEKLGNQSSVSPETLPKAAYRRAGIAYEGNLTFDIVKQLAEDKAPTVREAMAHNIKPSAVIAPIKPIVSAPPVLPPEPEKPITSIDIWRELANHKEVEGRQKAAAYLPIEEVELLRKLASDASADVVYCLVRREDLTAELLDVCSLNANWICKTGVLEHANVSIDTVRRLARDTDLTIVGMAACKLATLEKQTKAKPEAIEPTEASEAPTKKTNIAPYLIGAAGLAGMMLNAAAHSAPSVRVAETATEELTETTEALIEATT